MIALYDLEKLIREYVKENGFKLIDSIFTAGREPGVYIYKLTVSRCPTPTTKETLE